MQEAEYRDEHLGWVEVALRATNPDLPGLRIAAQCHYGPINTIAFIEVFGVDHDRDRRRALRKDAGDMLVALGYKVVLEPGRDIYFVDPVRPQSAHDRLEMLARLRSRLNPQPGAI